MAKAEKANFVNEAALCAAFISALPEGWTAYPETAGFDILLVRAADGAQIGVEAKMTLNAKVLLQAVEGIYSGHGSERDGPDFRAALVPAGTAGAELSSIARKLGVVVIECSDAEARDKHIARYISQYDGWGHKLDPAYIRKRAEASADQEFPKFKPALPALGGYDWRGSWFDFCPMKRCKLPEYVPDVTAGASGPSQLSEWKIKAIKIALILERRGWVCAADFKAISIDRKRWLDMGWIRATATRGRYEAGLPMGLRAQHPINYEQIAADYEKWAPKGPELLTQGELV